ncbi:hypothetical protein [Sphingobium ummariense]|uniref:hypothetical protein n=1 Tax=Sphingobium ummariense TaxID=420994 RepID=UPI0012690161|nr:hypothetical protein [Sphingobium ummariense]
MRSIDRVQVPFQNADTMMQPDDNGTTPGVSAALGEWREAVLIGIAMPGVLALGSRSLLAKVGGFGTYGTALGSGPNDWLRAM